MINRTLIQVDMSSEETTGIDRCSLELICRDCTPLEGQVLIPKTPCNSYLCSYFGGNLKKRKNTHTRKTMPVRGREVCVFTLVVGNRVLFTWEIKVGLLVIDGSYRHLKLSASMRKKNDCLQYAQAVNTKCGNHRAGPMHVV